MKRSYLIAVTLSIFMHLTVFGFLFNYNWLKTKSHVGNQVAVRAYAVNELAIIAKTKAANHNHKNTNEADFHRNSNKGIQHQHQHKNTASQLQQKQIAGKYDALLVILHNQILQQVSAEKYLLPAYFGSRTATAEFSMTPAGTIHNIRITKSFGIRTLDNFVTNTINNLQPFIPAKKYLNASTEFKLDIIFSAS